ncbi:hypothetical protein ACXZ9C_11130 [Streptococcus agalactiae]
MSGVIVGRGVVGWVAGGYRRHVGDSLVVLAVACGLVRWSVVSAGLLTRIRRLRWSR